MGSTRVTVLGGGVIGLVTARALVAEGFDVQVVADRPGEEATSGAAGAVWFPYQVAGGEDQPVYRWAQETYEALVELAREARSGVLPPLPMYLLETNDASGAPGGRPAWSEALPPGRSVEWIETRELPEVLRRYAAVREREGLATGGAWRFEAPVVHPARHLAWLREGLRGRVAACASPVADLGSLEGDVVVNCTGRRARSLTGDRHVRPSFGQVLVVTEASFPRDLVFADDRDERDLTYYIPRGEEVVLGGCSIEHREADGDAPWTRAERPPPRPDVTEKVLRRFAGLGLECRSYRAVAEWRPVREGRVRLEREGRVVHHYGHGGSGFTLAYGCARAAVEEVRRA